jgi:hypothetical protein
MEEILEEDGLSARERNRRKRLAKQETARGGSAQNGRSAKLEVKSETQETVTESKSDALLFETQPAGTGAWEVGCELLNK